MIIGHSIPASTWTVSGTGAALLADQFANARPDTLSRLRWLSGAQTTSSVLRLRAEWTGAIVPGLIYLAGGDLPAGTKVTVAWRRPGDSAGTYPYTPAARNSPQRVVRGPRGERTCAIVLEAGASPVVGCEISVWNDVDGVAAIIADSTITLGAVLVCAADEVSIDSDWSDTTVDPTITSASGTRAIYPTPGIPYRELSFAWVPDEQSVILGDRAALVAKLDRGQRAVYIPRYLDAAAAFAPTLAHQTARIGVMAKPPSVKHAAGPYMTASAATVIEVPVPV